MNCTCPKCKASTHIDHSEITEKGIDRICDACKSRFWLYRESFGGRALKKRGEIFCATCGGELDRSIACPSCGILYPEYVFAQATKAVPKRTVHVRSTYYIRRRPARKPLPKKTVTPKKPVKKLKIVNKYTISAAILAVLTLVGSVVYSKYQAVKEYSANYTKVLYGIKTGTDLSLKPFEKIASSSASSFSPLDPVPSLSSNEQSRLNTIKTQVDKNMKKTDNPPEKFVSAKENLNTLYGVYVKIHALALQSSGSIRDSLESAENLKTEFKKSSRELKSALPKQLSDELENARAKYRNLRDF
ncbi:MAG TPA: hypothetical protein PK036_06460 [Geobacteraceae bacterium]|nr:hypothetical protein [Geobacteraceae bacterium]